MASQSGYAFLGIVRLPKPFYDSYGKESPQSRPMVYDKAKRKRDRREADLLLNVVFGHMFLNSAKDYRSHKMAHDRFKNAVRTLHQFVTSENPEEGSAEQARS